MLNKVTKYLGCILIPLILFSCVEELKRNGTYETIYVNHEGADMPVFIRGPVTADAIIVVIHGGPGGNGLEYRFGSYSDQLEEKVLMAYWDQRGQGHSLGKYEDDKINVEQMAQDLQAVVLALKHQYGEDKKVFLLGHSWGGMLGTQYMVNSSRANLVNGWIEANGAHDIPFLNKAAIAMFRTISREQINAGNSVENWTDIRDWADAIDENNISQDEGGEINSKGFEVEGYLSEDGLISQGEVGAGDLKLIFNSPLNMAKSAVTGLYTSNTIFEEVESSSLTSQLSNITKPCLFLYSKYDFVVPPALGQDAFEKVSSSVKKLVIFENSGHSPMSNEPNLFVDEVLQFVAAN